MVTDTHVHLWHPDAPATPWRSGWARFAPRPRLSPEDLLAAMDAAGVDLAVAIPPEWDSRGNDLVLDSAWQHPDRIIAFPSLSLRDPSSPQVLSEWRTRTEFAGLRQVLLVGSRYAPLRDGTADWLWRTADEAELVVMVWAPGQLAELAEVARRHEGMHLVIDHLGAGMDTTPDDLDHVVDQLCRLALYPRVAVKASALPSMAADGFPFRSVHRSVRRVVDAFGPERVFWGSDFTRLSCTYARAVEMVHEIDGVDAGALLGGAFTTWLGSARAHSGI
jgi:predicted TIM-barrel fold metal-dependent hydrolase